jgi:hypothetical protein
MAGIDGGTTRITPRKPSIRIIYNNCHAQAHSDGSRTEEASGFRRILRLDLYFHRQNQQDTVDATNGMIVAQTLTDQDADDPSQVGPLLDQIDDPITQVTADGAYDGAPTYQTIAAHGDEIKVVIPPRSTAVPNGEPGPPTQRDRHLATIAEQGRLAWQATTGYGRRSLVETTMGRYKLLIGPRLRARGFAAQQTEAAIGVAVLNRMLATGRPDSVRRQPVIA